jgi:serine/threonine-protein kinase
MEGYEMLRDIPQFSSWSRIETVSNGWSDDRKYRILNNQGEHLLLRTADISRYDRKREEFQWLQKAAATGAPMPKAIDCGVCNGSRDVYLLLSWLEGAELKGCLGGLSPEDCHRLGVEAGGILRKIHQTTAPLGLGDYKSQMQEIFHQKMQAYHHCGLKVENGDVLLSFMDRSFQLLHGVPQCFLHGDFHPGNLVLGTDGKLSVIDFDRFEIGDSVRDFTRLAVFSRLDSVDFARGQIDGYFEDKVPDYFFPRLAFYAAFDSFFSLVWASCRGEGEVKQARMRIGTVYDDFAGFTRCIPGWYSNG